MPVKTIKSLNTSVSNRTLAEIRAFFSAPKSLDRDDSFSYPLWLQYIVMSLLTLASGNKMFWLHGHPRTAIFIIAAIFGMLLWRQDGNQVSKRFGTACLCFLGIFVLQAFFFLFFPIITIGGFFVRMFMVYAVCRIVRDFTRVYINVLFWLGIVSLCFFLPEQILRANGIDIREVFIPFRTLHLGIYEFNAPTRNSGMFWEAGAFGGYLLLAIIFLGLSKEHFRPRAFWIRFVILLVSLLSTYSTIAYMIIPFVLLVYFRLRENKAKAIRAFVLFYAFVLSLEAGAYYLNSLNITYLGKSNPVQAKPDLYRANVDSDFIFKKLWTQSITAFKSGPGRYRNRFDNIVADSEYIKRRPLLGWGLNDQTRYMLHRGSEYGSGHGVGLTDWLCKVGLVGLGVFSLCVLRSFIELTGGKIVMSLAATMFILMILNGECFLTHPLFMGLMFLESTRETRQGSRTGLSTSENYSKPTN